MSLSLNKVILAGRLTADPELKSTPSGTLVTSFTIAVDRRVAKDAEKKADFVSVVAWKQTAEFITKYFRKGSSLCITGSIQTRSWSAQDGSKRYATEVVADEAYFVESRNGGEAVQTAVATFDNSRSEPNYVDITDDDLPF